MTREDVETQQREHVDEPGSIQRDAEVLVDEFTELHIDEVGNSEAPGREIVLEIDRGNEAGFVASRRDGAVRKL